MPLSKFLNRLFSRLNVRDIPLSALPKDTTSKLAGLISILSLQMLSVKQGSCKSMPILKSFDLTRQGLPTVKSML